MPDQPVVRVGQVWADNDKRAAGRYVKVLGLHSRREHPVVRGRRIYTENVDVEYATCEVVADRHGPRFGPGPVGRRVEIRVDRFRPTSTGYRLVAYGCKPSECTPLMSPEYVGHWSEADGLWAWTCPHGRLYFGKTDSPWEPCYLPEELAERLGVEATS